MIKLLILMSLSLIVPTKMVTLPDGYYRPLYMSKGSAQTHVESFSIDVTPVTNQQHAVFITANPQWQPQSVPQIFAEPQYLQHWHNKNEKYPPKDQINSPVVNVSWFAADAYCHSLNKHLPSVAQWERVASASKSGADGSEEKSYHSRILQWYSRPSTKKLPAIGKNPANFWGVQDLHGLIWEWTEDFNSALISGESRGDSDINQKLFCAADPSDYAAFMRFGFRSSLQAKLTRKTYRKILFIN